jgi:hypothetical protein
MLAFFMYFMFKVKTALEEYRVNLGTVTEEMVYAIFKTVICKMNEQLAKVNCGVGVGILLTVADWVET